MFISDATEEKNSKRHLYSIIDSNLLLVLLLSIFPILFGQSQTGAVNIFATDSVLSNNYKWKNCAVFFFGENHLNRDCDKIAASIFSQNITNKSKVKFYFIEASSSFKYILEKKIQNENVLLYKKRKVVTIDKQKELKAFVENCNKLMSKDSLVQIITFDCEHSFNLPLLCLGDILQRSLNPAQFKIELDHLYKDFKMKSNITTLIACSKYLINSFISDSLKYKNNLTNDKYLNYHSIIKDLKFGLTYDSVRRSINDYYETASLREEFMYQKINRVLSSYDFGFAFIQAGLMHCLDSTLIGNNKYWVSIAEKLGNNYSICKAGMISLSNYRKEEQSIYDFGTQLDSDLRKRFRNHFLDVSKSTYLTMTKFDYLLFVE